MDSDKENSVDLNGSFSSSDLSPLTRLAVNRRPGRSSRSRQTVLPSKLKDQNVLLDSVLDTSRSARIRCSQNNREFTTSLKYLSKEDGTLKEDDLVKGTPLMWEYKKKSYPVVFLEMISKGKRTRSEMDKVSKESCEAKSKKAKTDSHDLMDQASAPSPSKGKEGTLRTTFLDQADKDLLLNLVQKVERVESKLDKILESLKSTHTLASSKVKQDDETSQDYIVNGVHLLRLHGRDAYAYALQLMDVLFTKDELSGSLLFKSKKSTKPALPHDRVQKLLDILDKKFSSGWDLKTLTQKANQKCRDTKVTVQDTQ